MGRISEARLVDVLPVLDRYRPVAIAATAILVVVTVLPGAERRDAVESAAPANVFSSTAAEDDEASTTGSASVAEPTAPAPSLPTAPTSFSGAAPSFSSTPSSGSGAGSGGAPPSVGGGSAPASFGSDADEETPLTPTTTAWATNGAGTPIAEVGVPEETLPVGTRLGSTDKASFVLLQGTATRLVLVEHPDGNRGLEPGAVQACRIETPGWEPGEAQSFDDAPTWDPDACAPGTRTDDGSWTFDLAAFEGRDDLRGFALVPGPEAPADFQVAFRLDA